MFSFVLVSHFSCALFRYFALYLATVLSVFVCVFLYWVRPLVILLTLGTFDGCAILAPHQILRAKLKKIPYGVFWVCFFERSSESVGKKTKGTNTSTIITTLFFLVKLYSLSCQSFHLSLPLSTLKFLAKPPRGFCDTPH